MREKWSKINTILLILSVMGVFAGLVVNTFDNQTGTIILATSFIFLVCFIGCGFIIENLL